MKNDGGLDVLEYAGRVRSAARRGKTLVEAFFDPVEGGHFILSVF
jgi:hypothetical protein